MSEFGKKWHRLSEDDQKTKLKSVLTEVDAHKSLQESGYVAFKESLGTHLSPSTQFDYVLNNLKVYTKKLVEATDPTKVYAYLTRPDMDLSEKFHMLIGMCTKLSNRVLKATIEKRFVAAPTNPELSAVTLEEHCVNWHLGSLFTTTTLQAHNNKKRSSPSPKKVKRSRSRK